MDKDNESDDEAEVDCNRMGLQSAFEAIRVEEGAAIDAGAEESEEENGEEDEEGQGQGRNLVAVRERG
jgi:hypothetical protein